MEILSLEEAAEFPQAHRLLRCEEEEGSKEEYAINADSGAKTGLAREIMGICNFPAVVWIDEYGIWTTSENLALFRLARNGMNEFRRLHEAPIHVFEEADKDEFFAVISMVLYFVWGCKISEADRHRAWRISHDEFISVSSNNHEAMLEARNVLSRFELRRIR